MNLEELLEEIEEKMHARDLSDEYLLEHGASTRKDVGINECFYGITMIPCEWVYPYLKELKNSIPKKKIEDKIKELESTKFGRCVDTIEILEELLEDK